MTASLTDRYVDRHRARARRGPATPRSSASCTPPSRTWSTPASRPARRPAPTPSTRCSSSSATPCGWPPATAVAPCTSSGRASTPSGSACAGAARRRRADLGGRQPRGAALRRRRRDGRHRLASSAAPSRWLSRSPSTSCSGRPSSSSSSSADRARRRSTRGRPTSCPTRAARAGSASARPWPPWSSSSLVALALVWQQTSSPVTSGGESVPVLDPALWSGLDPVAARSCSLAQAVLAVVVYRHGRWTAPARRGQRRCSTSRSPCRCSCCCAPATCSTRRSSTCSSRAAGPTPSATSTCRRPSACVVVLVWSVVETLRTRARSRRGPARRSGVERAHDLAERRRVPVDVGAGRGGAHQRHVVERRHEDAAVAHREVQVGVELVVVRRRGLLAGARRRPGEPVLRAGPELARPTTARRARRAWPARPR